MDIVVVKSTANGEIDMTDFEKKAKNEKLGAIMATYPSTHGV